MGKPFVKLDRHSGEWLMGVPVPTEAGTMRINFYSVTRCRSWRGALTLLRWWYRKHARSSRV